MKEIKKRLTKVETALFSQNKKEEQANELVVVNKDLAFQNIEKIKRAAELIISNNEVDFKNIEKEKFADELIIANKELNFQNGEKVKRASELLLANIELLLQNEEREKRTLELKAANKALKKIKKQQKKYIQGLEEMMFLTSHAVRKPVANILGIATQLDESRLPVECKELIEGMKVSALALDIFTQELTVKINTLKEKGKLNNFTAE